MRLITLLLFSATLVKAQSFEPLKLEKKIELPDVQGRIDHMSIDVKGQRLFVSALGNNTLEVIDLKTGKRANTISGLGEPQGTLYVASDDRLYVASSKDGTVKIFDGSSLKLLKTVDTAMTPITFDTMLLESEFMSDTGAEPWESWTSRDKR